MKRDWQREITVTRRVIAGESLRNVGITYGITRERTRQIVQRCLTEAGILGGSLRVVRKQPWSDKLNDLAQQHGVKT